MTDHPGLERFLHLDSLHVGEVVSYLARTLTETHDPVVEESTGVSVRGIGVAEAWKKTQKQLVNFRTYKDHLIPALEGGGCKLIRKA